jgi:hypothetical protein
VRVKPPSLQKPRECIIFNCPRTRTRRLHCEAHYIILAASLVTLIDEWRALEAMN